MKKLFSYLMPYRKSLVLVALIDAFGMISSLLMPFVMSEIVERGIKTQNSKIVLGYAAVMLILAIMSAAGNLLSAKLNASVGARFTSELCQRTFDKINSLSYADYSKIGPSGLLTRATDDIWNVEGAVTSLPYTLFTVPIMFIGSAALAFLSDPVLAAVFMLSIPPVLIVVLILMRPLYDMWDKSDKYVDMQNKIVRERLSGLRVVRAFNNEAKEHGRAKFATEEMAKYMIRANTRGGMVDPLAMLLLNLATVAVIYVGALRANNQATISAGDIIAVLQYIALISSALINISWTLAWLPKVKVSLRRIDEIHSLPDEEESEKTGQPKGFDIEINGLCFCYPDSKKNVLENISLKIAEGENVAIIGGTGSGKTTLIRLLSGLFEASDGDILLGGQSYRDMKKADIRSHFSVAMQKAQIFEGSIRENIKMGNPVASDDEIREVLRLSKMEDFVKQKEGGLDFLLVGMGRNVSGGQKQRLNMARAVIKDADIYIFDDSFSALDYLTESEIRENYRLRLNGKSRIVATQRISTAMSADRIYVMDKGKIVGVGVHRELMESCPIYREIAKSQLGNREVDNNEN